MLKVPFPGIASYSRVSDNVEKNTYFVYLEVLSMVIYDEFQGNRKVQFNLFKCHHHVEPFHRMANTFGICLQR